MNHQPLQDGCFFVDNSMIDLITTCPYLAYVSIVRQLCPTADSPALRFGGFIHQALAYRNLCMATNVDFDESHQINMLGDLFSASPLESEGWRSYLNAVKVLRCYNRTYPIAKEDYTICLTPDGKPFVEQSFAVDTHKVIRGWRVIYMGRMDLKVQKTGYGKFVFDHKTSSVLGDSTWADWGISDQFKGYCWADRECTGEEPIGYIIDAIGAKESIANAEFDDVLGQVIPTNPKSKAVPLELVRQLFFTRVPAGQLDDWFANMLEQVNVFLYHLERNSWPKHHHHCIGKYGACQFFNVCSNPTEQQRQDALSSAAFKTNDWSPLYL